MNTDRVVIRKVSVIDGLHDHVLPARNILIDNGVISGIWTGEAGEHPGATTIDGDGKFAVPGFIDAHVHCYQWCLPLFLSSGITSVRDMASESSWMLATRGQIEDGETLGPRVFTHGQLIDGPTSRHKDRALCITVRDGDEVAAAVGDLAHKGVDGIKLYSGLPLDVFKRGIHEAHSRGLPVSAHVGHSRMVTVRQAVASGADSIEHTGTCLPDLFPEGELRNVMAGLNTDKRQLRGFMAWARVDMDGPNAHEIAQVLAESRVYHVPTLVNAENTVRGGISEELGELAEIAGVPRSTVAEWPSRSPSRAEDWDESERLAAGEGLESIKRFTRMLYEAGVRLGVGSDAPNPWTIPGPSLVREMELLTECGIPPMKVLQLATSGAARALGPRFAKTGAVAEGCRADVVILNADPTASISNCSRISHVIRQGVLLGAKT